MGFLKELAGKKPPYDLTLFSRPVTTDFNPTLEVLLA